MLDSLEVIKASELPITAFLFFFFFGFCKSYARQTQTIVDLFLSSGLSMVESVYVSCAGSDISADFTYLYSQFTENPNENHPI